MEVLPSYPPSYSGKKTSCSIDFFRTSTSKAGTVYFMPLLSLTGSGIDGGLPGPSHGNAELNQEQQGK